jgi:hypothetical protein
VYIKTCDKLDRSELDRRAGHLDSWTTLLAIYTDKSRSELGKIAFDLTRYGYTDDEPSDFDEDLSPENFCDIVKFMNYWYGQARSKKNTSGQHLDFESFVNGKGWLLFYHKQLQELGDTDVMNATYATLPSDVFAMSGNNSASEVSSTASASSKSAGCPSSSKGGQLSASKKLLVTARLGAADAIQEKNLELSALTKLQLLKVEMEMKESQGKTYESLVDLVFDLEEKLLKVRHDIKISDHGDKEKCQSLRRFKKHLKNKISRAQTQIEKLKKTMNLKEETSDTDGDSPSDSDDSD